MSSDTPQSDLVPGLVPSAGWWGSWICTVFLGLLLQAIKIFSKSPPAFLSPSGFISPHLGKGGGDIFWTHGAGKSCLGLLHCPVIHANTDQHWSQAGELSCGFLPVDVNGESWNLIFQPVVEVSCRNFMCLWFLGLVYGSVTTEKPRNEDK